MATELPPAIALKVQQTLSQWQRWDSSTPLTRAPALLARLEPGRSNVSVRVGSGDNEFVIRVDGISPQQLGLSRSAEWRAHYNAAQQDLAPRPVYSNLELGVLVSEFCHADQQLLMGTAELAATAELLRSIHALPAIKFRLRPLDRIARYSKQLDLGPPSAEITALCQHLQGSTQARLCHNDLLRSNRLQRDGELLAIDWEYAAMGDPWFDLAVVCEGDQLSAQDCDDLVSHYLQKAPGAEQLSRLQDNRKLYRAISSLWEQFTGR